MKCYDDVRIHATDWVLLYCTRYYHISAVYWYASTTNPALQGTYDGRTLHQLLRSRILRESHV